MNGNECAARISEELSCLGIRPGETILVHSSFKSLGIVPGGIDTVLKGLCAAIAPNGTLLMPALSWALRPPEVWDYYGTSTNTGAIPEYFRKSPGVLRSIHPTHSVCALGPRAHELLEEHRKDCTPCGPHSPFRKLADTKGKIIMLGCGLAANTMMHALEEIVCPPYLLGPGFVFTLTDERRCKVEKDYRTHGFKTHGYKQRYDRVALLKNPSFLRKGTVLEAEVFVMDAPGLKSAVLSQLRRDPFFFVDKAT